MNGAINTKDNAEENLTPVGKDGPTTSPQMVTRPRGEPATKRLKMLRGITYDSSKIMSIYS